MGVNILFLVAGLILLLLSGNWLVKGSVQIARHLSISPLVIGLTVMAFGTSAPEMFVSVKAAFNNVPEIAVGNVIGSNIANIALVLGVVSLIFPIMVNSRTLWIDWVVMMAASGILYLMSLDHHLGLAEGLLFLSALAGYLIWMVIHSKKQSREHDKPQLPDMKLTNASLLVLAAFVGLYFGAEFLINGAKNIAIGLGVSQRVVGVTIVAFGTSIPEFVSSLMASFRKENELSLGNIIGSNTFNILAILGVISTIKPINIDPVMVTNDYPWMMALPFVLLVFMFPLRKGKITRWEGLLLFTIYLGYLYFLLK
jgi:cation:H+ antiporter